MLSIQCHRRASSLLHSRRHRPPSHSFSSSYPYSYSYLSSLACTLAQHEAPRPCHHRHITGTNATTATCNPRLPPFVQVRGKTTKTKTSTSVESNDLSQELPPLEPVVLEDEGAEYPTALLQVRNNMRKFDNCVLLTRMGGFYELYFQHAEEFGPLLNLKVAQKRARSNGSVSMAGFPFYQLDRYLKILVQDLNRYVAIAEEFPNSPSEKVKSGGLMHDRRVSRIVTPGTLIDENFMDPLTNNYVLAIHAECESNQSTSCAPVGLAWLDLSTGHFFTHFTTLPALPSFLSRIGPREIVLNRNLQELTDHPVLSLIEADQHLISFVDTREAKPTAEWSQKLESPISAKEIAKFTPEEMVAIGTLLHYVETRLQGSNMKLQPPSRQFDVMGIDKNTMRALEIKQTMSEDKFTGSLLHTIRRTVSKGGARLLQSWLTSPSTSLHVINSRLDLVTNLLQDENLRERVVILLRRIHDSHRLLQKFAFGRGGADDLLALASTISATQELMNTLAQDSEICESVKTLISRIQLDGPDKLAVRVKEAIDEDGIVQQHRIEDGEAEAIKSLAHEVVASAGSTEDLSILPKGDRKKKPPSIKEFYSDDNQPWIMKPAASPTLERLHKDLVVLSNEKQILAEDLRTRLGATSLTLRYSPGLGHICHVKGKDLKKDFTEVKSVSSSKSTRSLHHPEWTHLGQRLDQCKVHIRAEEQRVFNDFREQVIVNIIKLRRNASVLDELDVACSFATLALERGWVPPILNHSSRHNIIGGSHPTVEGGLEQEGRSFIRNDCSVGDVRRTWLITGPNMAGKSTFLRQNALITILAQVGSYVPAQYAELGIVDQIFSRVGSADNLYKDQSTFMVEMLETAMILKNATSKSFVIMDEIGRGTTPSDGIAVAFACLHHLHHVNKSRTLFATHFHTLADMIAEEAIEGVGFYCTDVEEDGGGGNGFRYVHKLRQGVNRESHALKVARLAGIPEDAISVAQKLMDKGTVQI